MKITKSIELESLPHKVNAILSNGVKVDCYRATLVAYLNRGYYFSNSDTVERAYVLN